MPIIASFRRLKSLEIATAILLGSLVTIGSIAFAAQDRFTLKAPNGIAFAEFRGYEDWRDVAVSRTEDGIKLIAANSTMIEAYKGRALVRGIGCAARSAASQRVFRE
jgi:hypothetical protein